MLVSMSFKRRSADKAVTVEVHDTRQTNLVQVVQMLMIIDWKTSIVCAVGHIEGGEGCDRAVVIPL